MRITTSMMTHKYVRNLNKNGAMLNELNEKATTGRKFFKGSEDPIGAIKAYKLRREYKETEMYDTNIGDVDSYLTVAETNLTEISNNMNSVYTSYLKGINGTMSVEDREIVAKKLENLQESILTSLNAKISDRYVFGGTSRDEVPFTKDAAGNLLYKGINVNSTDSADQAKLKELEKESVNIDLGLDLKFSVDAVTGSEILNKDTVFDISMAGIKFMGYGSNADGIPNNLYTLVGKIKDELKSSGFSMDSIKPYINNYEEQKKKVLVNVTDIGAKTNYLEFLKLRNEDNQFNLNKKILDVEYVDRAEAITEFKMQEYSYNAALAMGNKILQNSFIDFMK